MFHLLHTLVVSRNLWLILFRKLWSFLIKVVLIRLGIYLFVNKARSGGSPKFFINTLLMSQLYESEICIVVMSQLYESEICIVVMSQLYESEICIVVMSQLFHQKHKLWATKVSKEDFYLWTWAKCPTILKTTLILNRVKLQQNIF